MPRVRTRRIGAIRIHTLEAGSLRLDGGAMFGVVPRPLWEREAAPDDRNRILLAMRCLLIETPAALVLVDTGLGVVEDEKFREIHAVENSGQPTALEDAIRAAGHDPSDVSVVINSHLHFDHAGGNTVRSADGAALASFPRARYVVQRAEWDYAHRDNERVRAGYWPQHFDPLEESIERIEGEVEVVPGVRVLPTPGHTPGHQSVLIESESHAAIYLADLVPTVAHLRPGWIMGYDVEPLTSFEYKRRVLEQARRERWLLLFEHDPETAWGYLSGPEKRPTLVDEPD